MTGREPDPSTVEQPLRVREILDGFFAESKQRAAVMSPRYVRLWETLELSTVGGKQFRPRLLRLSFDCLGGNDSNCADYAAAAFELLHTALLIHDDVIDHDFIRRGIPNISGIYRDSAEALGHSAAKSERFGNAAAVIAGDLSLFYAYRLLQDCPTGPTTKQQLAQIMDEAVFASAGGELLDVEHSLVSTDVSTPDVIAMERLKTAVYSFEAPLKAGAVLAEAGLAVTAQLGRIGCEMGIAFQIVDDILGVFGDNTVTGKSTVNDLREGKRTVLTSYASTRPEWPDIQELLGRSEMSDDDAGRLRLIIAESGARKFAENLARTHAARAERLLGSRLIPVTLREGLQVLIAETVDRES